MYAIPSPWTDELCESQSVGWNGMLLRAGPGAALWIRYRGLDDPRQAIMAHGELSCVLVVERTSCVGACGWMSPKVTPQKNGLLGRFGILPVR